MNTPSTINILFLGDVIGQPGRKKIAEYLNTLTPSPHLVIANVENAAHGFGVTESIVKELSAVGVSVFSGGNHTFDRKEIFEFIDKCNVLLRPANYPEGTPGRGWCVVEVAGVKVGVINLMGRVFMEPLRSPFVVADQLLNLISKQARIVIVDMHAEATAEKVAMGWYLDGRVTAVLGTHTHVQTADERILPGGTAYITDMGCCGPIDGIIGMEKESVFHRLVHQLPSRLEVAPGLAAVHGVKLTIDIDSGKALAVERVRYPIQG